MQLTLAIDSAIASAKLWALMLRIRDPTKLHKIWGVRVMNQARANARAKGGRRLWKQIADSVVLQSVSQRGADIRGVGLFGRIGMHKEKGGPIRVRGLREYQRYRKTLKYMGCKGSCRQFTSGTD